MEVLVKELIAEATKLLKQNNISDADIDSWLLAEHILGCTRQKYFMNPSLKVNDDLAEAYQRAVLKRADHTPLQHITGTQCFMDYTFKVNEDVLIPRPETELLVDRIVRFVGNKKVSVLDMCTGSGCIAISIDKMCDGAKVDAVDISEKAVDVAKENNAKNNADVHFIHSDLFENVKNTYDIIVSNPPYIPSADIDELMEEVKNHEPTIALDGKKDGLLFYKKICSQANDYLNENGKIYFEIGYDQGGAVKELLKENHFKNIQVLKDLSGLDRMVIAGKE